MNEINSMDHYLKGVIKETLKEKPYMEPGFEPLQYRRDGSTIYRIFTHRIIFLTWFYPAYPNKIFKILTSLGLTCITGIYIRLVTYVNTNFFIIFVFH